MAITVGTFGLTQKKALDRTGTGTNGIDVDLLGNTVKFSLHTATYTPNADTDDFFNDATNELTGSGYAQQTLGGKTITYDSTSHQVRFDCNDITVPFNATSTWRHGIVWIDTAGASTTDPLYAYLSWDSNQTVSTSYTLTIDPAGLLFWDVL